MTKIKQKAHGCVFSTKRPRSSATASAQLCCSSVPSKRHDAAAVGFGLFLSSFPAASPSPRGTAGGRGCSFARLVPVQAARGGSGSPVFPPNFSPALKPRRFVPTPAPGAAVQRMVWDRASSHPEKPCCFRAASQARLPQPRPPKRGQEGAPALTERAGGVRAVHAAVGVQLQVEADAHPAVQPAPPPARARRRQGGGRGRRGGG